MLYYKIKNNQRLALPKIRKRKDKVQKIKPKYQKYVNIMFTIMIGVVIYFMYIVYINQELIKFSPQKSNGGGFGKAFGGSFQPGDEKNDFPGKLKWGRDF